MKYLATVSYLGTHYYGFNKQPGKVTVQGELERAVSGFLGVPSTIKASGRTDAGVHAKGQRFTFVSARELDVGKAQYALNRFLSPDIRVLSVVKVSDGFDVRRMAVAKLYSYRFHLGMSDPLSLPLEDQLECKEFDMGLFKECLKLYVGKHDFSCFTSKEEDLGGFVREIHLVDFRDGGDSHYSVWFKGNGFMRYEVRTLIGVAYKVAQGKVSIDEVKERLSPTRREIFPFVASPNGLTLEEVYYDEGSY